VGLRDGIEVIEWRTKMEPLKESLLKGSEHEETVKDSEGGNKNKTV
jgi:hypothetical protein